MTAKNFEINVVPFDPPVKEKEFNFYADKSKGLIPFSVNEFESDICEFFPELEGTSTQYLYSDFSADSGKGKLININLERARKFAKHYYNFLLFNYFENKVDIINSNFVKDNELWLLDENQSTEDFEVYNKFSIKIQVAVISKQPELVISFDGISKVFRKSYTEFDLSTALINKVIYKNRLYRYENLPENILLDKENIFPVLNYNLCKQLEYSFRCRKTTYKYKKYYENIATFYEAYLNNEDFRNVIPISEKGFYKIYNRDVKSTTPGCNELIFGNEVTDINPNKGIKENGPYQLPTPKHISFFFIIPREDIETGKLLIKYFKGEVPYIFEGMTLKVAGLLKYARLNFFVDKDKSIPFDNLDNPLPEIREKLANTKYPGNITYCALYVSPYSKDKSNPTQHKFYYQIKEELLKYGITSQVIEKETINRVDFRYSLPNLYIAILAKLNAIPWRLQRELKNELIVGIGAFKSTHSVKKYIGSAFCFSNDGHFQEFECYTKSEMFLLTGSIEKAVKSYIQKFKKADRLIIHFYKTMSHKELEPIVEMLNQLGLDIPVIVVSINKTESKHLILFDKSSPELMPLSGSFYNIGRNQFLLCNNTRYKSDTKVKGNEYPFPIKLSINSTNQELINDEKAINDIIDQVYQFSRMYWKSISQQNLPVTIKYPAMVAEIFTHFESDFIPSFGQNSLWFL